MSVTTGYHWHWVNNWIRWNGILAEKCYTICQLARRRRGISTDRASSSFFRQSACPRRPTMEFLLLTHPVHARVNFPQEL